MYNCWNQTITEHLRQEKMSFFLYFSSFFSCHWSFFSGHWARQDSGPDNLGAPPSNTPLVARTLAAAKTRRDCTLKNLKRSHVSSRIKRGKVKHLQILWGRTFASSHDPHKHEQNMVSCTHLDVQKYAVVACTRLRTDCMYALWQDHQKHVRNMMERTHADVQRSQEYNQSMI